MRRAEAIVGHPGPSAHRRASLESRLEERQGNLAVERTGVGQLNPHARPRRRRAGQGSPEKQRGSVAGAEPRIAINHVVEIGRDISPCCDDGSVGAKHLQRNPAESRAAGGVDDKRLAEHHPLAARLAEQRPLGADQLHLNALRNCRGAHKRSEHEKKTNDSSATTYGHVFLQERWFVKGISRPVPGRKPDACPMPAIRQTPLPATSRPTAGRHGSSESASANGSEAASRSVYNDRHPCLMPNGHAQQRHHGCGNCRPRR